MRFLPLPCALVAAACVVLSSPATAQGPHWVEDFEAYAIGSPVGGQGIWEPFSGAVVAAPPFGASNGDRALRTDPGSDNVANFNSNAQHPTSGEWRFTGQVYHTQGFEGRQYWILLNTYNFGGPLSWSVQVFFDGTQNLVDCDCDSMNNPAGPEVLQRDAWVPVEARIDLDADTVDVFYDDVSLTAGQGYTWTTGVFGSSSGLLEVQALDLYPDVPGNPTTTECYYDDFELLPPPVPLGTADPQCSPVANSTGVPALFTLTGSGVAGLELEARVTQGPVGQFGYVIFGPNAGAYVVPPGSSGLLCIAGPQFRYNRAALGHLFQFDGSGTSEPVGAPPGPNRYPTDGSVPGLPAIGAGETWTFQAWYRDVFLLGSNFSGSLSISFL
ncbi:MAG: hypothetical protein GY711_12330 [bacterium]|nr:hypothetical protein [bacterium]